MIHLPRDPAATRIATLVALLLVLGTASARDDTLSFEAALALADASPTVEDARTGLELARLDLEAARGVVEGSLSASGDASLDPVGGDGDAGASVSVNASATLNVVPFGPRAEALARAENAVLRAEDDLEAARREAAMLVTRAYADAAGAAREAAEAEGGLALAEARLAATRARLEAGAENEAGLLQAEIGVTQAADAFANATAEARAALAELSRTLGVAVTAVSDDLPAAAPIPVPSDEGAIDARIALRADVVAAGLDLAEAETSLAAAERATGPTASVDLSYRASSGATSFQLGAGFDTGSYQPSVSAGVSSGTGGAGAGGSSGDLGVGLGLSVPLGRGGSIDVRAAGIALETARARLERARAAARAEVEALRRSLASAEASRDLAARLVAQAEASAEATRTRYGLGLASVLDRDEAELALLEVRHATKDAHEAYVLAAMELAAALAYDPVEVLR